MENRAASSKAAWHKQGKPHCVKLHTFTGQCSSNTVLHGWCSERTSRDVSLDNRCKGMYSSMETSIRSLNKEFFKHKRVTFCTTQDTNRRATLYQTSAVSPRVVDVKLHQLRCTSAFTILSNPDVTVVSNPDHTIVSNPDLNTISNPERTIVSTT